MRLKVNLYHLHKILKYNSTSFLNRIYHLTIKNPNRLRLIYSKAINNSTKINNFLKKKKLLKKFNKIIQKHRKFFGQMILKKKTNFNN